MSSSVSTRKGQHQCENTCRVFEPITDTPPDNLNSSAKVYKNLIALPLSQIRYSSKEKMLQKSPSLKNLKDIPTFRQQVDENTCLYQQRQNEISFVCKEQQLYAFQNRNSNQKPKQIQIKNKRVFKKHISKSNNSTRLNEELVQFLEVENALLKSQIFHLLKFNQTMISSERTLKGELEKLKKQIQMTELDRQYLSKANYYYESLIKDVLYEVRQSESKVEKQMEMIVAESPNTQSPLLPVFGNAFKRESKNDSSAKSTERKDIQTTQETEDDSFTQFLKHGESLANSYSILERSKSKPGCFLMTSPERLNRPKSFHEEHPELFKIQR